MSTVERNKGVLLATSIDTRHFTADDFEIYSELGFVAIDGEMYGVQWEVQRETDCDYFAEVEVDEATGNIHFHTMHCSGGGHWTEVVEEALTRDQ